MSAQAGNHRGSSKQDYQTPPEFIQAVVKGFGRLSWDLAASAENKQAEKFYGESDDSLTQCWRDIKSFGRGPVLWLNPPYDNIAPWARKCAEESTEGNARVLFLVPASVGANWFRDYVHGKAHVLFLNGRIKFVGAKDAYPKDCILACFGWNPGYSVWSWNDERTILYGGNDEIQIETKAGNQKELI